MQIQALDSRRHIRDQVDDRVYRFSPAIPRLPGVTAVLAYLAPATERPYNHMYEPPAGTARENCEYRARPVWIKDARAMASPPAIHVEGFELWDAPSAVTDFTDQDAIRSRATPKRPSSRSTSPAPMTAPIPALMSCRLPKNSRVWPPPVGTHGGRSIAHGVGPRETVAQFHN
jgi:hypothetical protein